MLRLLSGFCGGEFVLLMNDYSLRRQQDPALHMTLWAYWETIQWRGRPPTLKRLDY
jgi:hypothetical protein